MFRVVVRQICKCCTSAEIHLVDVEVLSFDLPPYTALVGEVSDMTRPIGILFSTRLPSDLRTVRKNNPSFTLTALFFL